MSNRKPCTFPTCMDQCKSAEPRPGGPLNLKPTRQVLNCKPCCDPPDWINHSQLRFVKEGDLKNYRQCRLQKWLEHLVNRLPYEGFGPFIRRCYKTADHELKENNDNKECCGDQFPHILDRYVWRLWSGTKYNIAKHGVNVDANEELLLLQFLREECNELYWADELIPNHSNWDHT
ncbi:hypothetical protein KC19_7G111000 [Ceratodon purpureus]|uniref:Uncharacterized protein n=1 Tax=Ceratodon purpureus TaxID=3225 RepID=A0A8T0HDG8_CERPU|nr:hypothetical protein KC19_7G111000 [Ceratodon purpureus]